MLKPVGSSGVSARARVAPPDPNRIPLEPTPEELAARAEAERQVQAAQQAAYEQAMRDQAAHEQAMREHAAHEQAARDEAARRQAAHEQAIRDQAAREQAARDEAAWQQAARDEAARQHLAHEQMLRDQVAREQAAREQAGREQAARDAAAAEHAAREHAASQEAARQQALEQASREKAMREHAARAAQAAAAAQTGQIPAVRSTPAQAFPHYAPGPVADPTPWSAPVPDAEVPTSEPKRRQAGRWALVAGVIVVLLLGGGFIGLRTLRDKPQPNLAKVPVFGTPGAVLGAPAGDSPIPSRAALAAALAKPLKDARLGSHVSFQVSDLVTGEALFGQNQLSPTTPASTMKLATAGTLLNLLGPNHRFTTKVVAGSKPGVVVLVGGGDPTLTAAAKSANYPGAASLSDLANQVKQALGGTKPTQVVIDTSLFTGPTTAPGWEPSDAHSSYATPIYSLTTDGGRKDPSNVGDAKRYDNTALAAGQLFAKELGLPATAVVSGRAGAGATELGSVQSAPLLRILDTMLITSDNVVAEFMARQVAIAVHRPASFAGAADAVEGELAKMGVPMQGVTIVDGSGLSPKDKLTPAMLASLLHYAASDDHPTMHGIFSGLPVAGWSGTLAGRFDEKGSTGARGLFRAKTGTLDGVHALAGTLIDASGRPLIFILLLDNVAWNARYDIAMDKLGAAVAACGCSS